MKKTFLPICFAFIVIVLEYTVECAEQGALLLPFIPYNLAPNEVDFKTVSSTFFYLFLLVILALGFLSSLSFLQKALFTMGMPTLTYFSVLLILLLNDFSWPTLFWGFVHSAVAFTYGPLFLIALLPGILISTLFTNVKDNRNEPEHNQDVLLNYLKEKIRSNVN